MNRFARRHPEYLTFHRHPSQRAVRALDPVLVIERFVAGKPIRDSLLHASPIHGAHPVQPTDGDLARLIGIEAMQKQ